MKIVNNRFLNYCVELLHTYPSIDETLQTNLETKLTCGMIEIHGCFLFQQHAEGYSGIQEFAGQCVSSEDKIFFELDHNEMCMLDYGFAHTGMYSKRDATKAFSMGITTSYRLAKMLQSRGRFRIIHSFGYDLLNGTISSYISFNKVRDDQPDWVNYLRDEINGMMVILTGLENQVKE